MEKSTENTETSIVPMDIPMMDIETLTKLTAFVNDVKKALMVEGQDYVIKGKKQYTSRSGFAKLAQGFNLSDEILDESEITHDNEFYGFDFTIRVFNPLGRQATGVGSCTVDEPNIKAQHQERLYHDCRSIAYTRAWNRAISNFVGSAEVSAEEMSLDSDSRKDVDSEQRNIYTMPKKLTTPQGNLLETIQDRQWAAVNTLLEGYLVELGFKKPNEAFEWGHDIAKAWIALAPGVALGKGWKKVDKALKAAGFQYSTNEKRWRLTKPEGVE